MIFLQIKTCEKKIYILAVILIHHVKFKFFFFDDDETFQIISLLLEREQFWSFQARHQKNFKVHVFKEGYTNLTKSSSWEFFQIVVAYFITGKPRRV